MNTMDMVQDLVTLVLAGEYAQIVGKGAMSGKEMILPVFVIVTKENAAIAGNNR